MSSRQRTAAVPGRVEMRCADKHTSASGSNAFLCSFYRHRSTSAWTGGVSSPSGRMEVRLVWHDRRSSIVESAEGLCATSIADSDDAVRSKAGAMARTVAYLGEMATTTSGCGVSSFDRRSLVGLGSSEAIDGVVATGTGRREYLPCRDGRVQQQRWERDDARPLREREDEEVTARVAPAALSW
eukprot:TRINITY_DN68681_c0_g1_i1.p2 TRINITY_DN68681_c0_g1~~TRINITY_DN68681_c0_g1_i1.p2  ORF type:complete len:184 (+),score=21.42 TRINITY_DN68681_c0_g1_i1:632-1183(+)